MASLYYAARLSNACEPHRRRARQAQSQDADALLGDLRRTAGLTQGPASKSHARAFCAAAAAGIGHVGVDVEWFGAPRDHAALSNFLLGARRFREDVEALYRVWTYREAHFKAFGVFPELAQRHAIFSSPVASGEVLRLGESAVLFQRLAHDFLLCVVWDGGNDFIHLL